MPKTLPPSVPRELIEQKIYLMREHKVMLDADLAELYGVTTGNLNLAVRRNLKRFPEDFMFQLSREETQFLLLQNARAKEPLNNRLRDNQPPRTTPPNRPRPAPQLIESQDLPLCVQVPVKPHHCAGRKRTTEFTSPDCRLPSM
jgi:hypothetical protein